MSGQARQASPRGKAGKRKRDEKPILSTKNEEREIRLLGSTKNAAKGYRGSWGKVGTARTKKEKD